MPIDVAGQAVAWVFRETQPADPLSIVWHAGEPLVLPPDWYAAAFASARTAAPPGARLRHHFQTNATLIDDRWCDFFREHHVDIGVSLDGPAHLHDRHRRSRGGAGTHKRVMASIATLQRRVIPFHVICVVHNATLDAADELADFFIGAGITRVGLNVEEIEGVNRASSLDGEAADRYATFLDRLLERAERHGNLHIREADAFVAKLTHFSFGTIQRNDENRPFAIVTIAHDGGISTYSPELAELEHPVHGPFRFGTVADATRASILADPRFQAIEAEIAAGVRRCADECRHFAFCAGGAPSNKLAEHGSLAATETLHCRLTQKTASNIMLRRLNAQLVNPHSLPRTVAAN